MIHILALGNAGSAYAKTRHNAGKIVLEEILSLTHSPRLSLDIKNNSEISSGSLSKDTPFSARFPTTGMNASGKIFKNLPKESILPSLFVIYDDIDLPLGTIRISFSGGSGGHNGIRSLETELKTKAFYRIRIGICPINTEGVATKPPKEKVPDFVLGVAMPQEIEIYKKSSSEIVKALTVFHAEGFQKMVSMYGTFRV
jgi:peptidyl-tRNA hydrolase, PTH1 family